MSDKKNTKNIVDDEDIEISTLTKNKLQIKVKGSPPDTPSPINTPGKKTPIKSLTPLISKKTLANTSKTTTPVAKPKILKSSKDHIEIPSPINIKNDKPKVSPPTSNKEPNKKIAKEESKDKKVGGKITVNKNEDDDWEKSISKDLEKEDLKNQKKKELLNKNQQAEKEDTIKLYETFESMGLSTNILSGIYGYGYESPSIVQQQGIVPIIKGKNLVIQGPSGTGKTCVFAIGLLHIVENTIKNYIDTEKKRNKNTVSNIIDKHCYGLIVSPTRELAEQTIKVIQNLSNDTNIRTCLITGAVRTVRDDIIEIKNNSPNIIVATLGRLAHLLSMKQSETKLSFAELKLLVIDECDQMLEGEFLNQFSEILKYVPDIVQICAISATYTENVKDIINKFIYNPIKIFMKGEELTLDGITQFYNEVEEEKYKYGYLYDMYTKLSLSQTVIFVNSVKRANELKHKLEADEQVCSIIHGEIDATERRATMASFKRGESRILIATDLIARGIDVQQVSIVINYDFPPDQKVYLHRIGRSGRFGRKGIAINFITPADIELKKATEKEYGLEMIILDEKAFEDLGKNL